ncbi:unnamed protein product [Ixodes hexagonus]
MSWFDTAGFANLAKSALNSAQKRIDRALDIQEDGSSAFALPTDVDSFFLSFGLGDNQSPSKQPTSEQPTSKQPTSEQPTSKQPTAARVELQASPQVMPKASSGWGTFVGAASVVSKPFSDPSAILSQPTKAPVADDTAIVSSVDAEPPAVIDTSGSESPLTIDFPNYAPLEQSAESDGSTDTLLGASLPESSSSSNQSRESFLDWQDSAKETKDGSTVVVREPEHVPDVGFPSRHPADDVGPTEAVVSDQSDGAIEGPPQSTTEKDAVSSSTMEDEAPVHKADELGAHNLFVMVDSTVIAEAKTVQEDLQGSGAGDGCGDWTESVCSRLEDESNDKAGDEADGHDSGSKTPVTGSTVKEDVDLQSVAGSLQSMDTSSSASFVRISTEETEDSRKSSSPSGDEEGETVSSSDIEIISSPNGGSSCDQFSGVLPARHLWEMQRESQEEKRSESPELAEDRRDPLASVLDSSPSRLGEHMSEEEKLRARVNELQGVLDARERKVFLLSKEIAEMSDSNAALQSSLRKLEELRSKENQDVSSLTQEFTHRLAKLETRLLDTSRERDALKSRLEAVQQESVTKVSISQMDVLLKEKDEQIAELMSEGKKKLSKQHLQQSTIIKKLRAKEKDMENVIKSHKERLEDQSKELDRLRRSMSAKDDQEKKHIDTIRQLTSSNHKLEKDVQNLQESVADAHMNLADAMAKLDNAYSEIAELRHANSECETRAEEATLSAKMAAGEEIRRAMEQTKMEAAAERTTLLQRIEELQMALTVADQRAERREDVLRINVRELQQQLQEAEVRNQEITQNLSSATRPLLRQIENLQSTFSVQSASWERVEKSLTDRLNEAQTHATLLAERERSLGEKCADLQLRVTALETQNATLRREKQELAADVQELRERQRDFDEFERREATFEAIKTRLEQSLRTLRSEKEELSTQLRSVQEELESEAHKTALLEGQLRAEREKRLENSSTPSPTVSHYSSVSDTFNCNLSEDLGHPYSAASTPRVSSVYESLRGVGGSTLLESLQSQLKMREGEVGHLQGQIGQLERCRESLSQELISLAGKHEQWEQELQELRGVRKLYEDINQKYNTLLQMYGEKVEQAEELRLDLEDVKSMYKAQVPEHASQAGAWTSHSHAFRPPKLFRRDFKGKMLHQT